MSYDRIFFAWRAFSTADPALVLALAAKISASFEAGNVRVNRVSWASCKKPAMATPSATTLDFEFEAEPAEDPAEEALKFEFEFGHPLAFLSTAPPLP